MAFEVRRVSARIVAAVLGQEDAVGDRCPPRACSSDVVWSEPRWETLLVDGPPDVIDDTAHPPYYIEDHESVAGSASPGR